MVGYEWTCKACNTSNLASTNICSSCGCPATASSEEVDKRLYPAEYNRKKAKELYIKKLTQLIYAPFFSTLYILNGNQLVLALLLVSVVLLFTSQKQFIKFLMKEPELRRVLALTSLSLTATIGTRVLFVPNESDLVHWFAMFSIIIPSIAYYFLFKSHVGIEAFERYYSTQVSGESF